MVAQLQTATLNIVGVGTHWRQGETTVSFGPGVVADPLTVNSPTTAQVQITVLSSSPVGYAALTTYTDGEVVTLQQAIDIEEGFPTLLAISPTGAEQGDTLNLQVLGRFTNWQQGRNFRRFQSGHHGELRQRDRLRNLVLNITVSPLGLCGLRHPCGHVLTVTTGTSRLATASAIQETSASRRAQKRSPTYTRCRAIRDRLCGHDHGSATNFLQA